MNLQQMLRSSVNLVGLRARTKSHIPGPDDASVSCLQGLCRDSLLFVDDFEPNCFSPLDVEDVVEHGIDLRALASTCLPHHQDHNVLEDMLVDEAGWDFCFHHTENTWMRWGADTIREVVAVTSTRLTLKDNK